MMHVVLFLLMFSADRGSPSLEPDHQTDPVRTVYQRKTPTLLQQNYLSLPMYVDSDLPLVEKEYFSPARGTGQEPLPSPVRELLLPVWTDTNPPSVAAVTVRTSCERNKMQLQVERNILGGGESVSHLKLGSCHVTKTTRDYLYFEHDLGTCGTKRSMLANRMVYFNTLHYDPPKPNGPIRRTAPFSLPIACYFNRYVYSYKIGYMPKMQMRKVLKKMKNSAKFVLTPRDAQWKKLPQSHHYVLGEPMFFEAEVESLSSDERLFVHTCYATPEKSHTSSPQYPVIRNFGCLVEGKNSDSRFFPHKNNVVRFSVDAFLFKGMSGQQLYMHCTMLVGGSVPTPTAKSCNYDTKARRWVELFGSNAVCDCCDSNCDSEHSAGTSDLIGQQNIFPETQVITSTAWTINPKGKPTPPDKERKTVSMETTTRQTTKKTATTTKQTTKTTKQTKTTRGTTGWKSWPEESADFLIGEVGVEMPELPWPLRGEGGMWVDEDSEVKQVKGSAVVDEENKKVSKPLSVFEEIFYFDK